MSSLQDSLFSEEVESDIKLFAVKETRKRVLVFPPVNNYRRFLIHQLVQDQFTDQLYTFSIGQGAYRRTVVCYKTDVIRDPKLNGALHGTCGIDQKSNSACAMGVEGHKTPIASPENSRQRPVKSVPSIGIYRPPAARKARSDNPAIDSHQYQPTPDLAVSIKSSRQKRPDRAVYVPRHRRSNELEAGSISRESTKPSRSTGEKRKTISPARKNSENCDSSSDLSRAREEEEPQSLDSSSYSQTTNGQSPCEAFENLSSSDSSVEYISNPDSLNKISDEINDEKSGAIETNDVAKNAPLVENEPDLSFYLDINSRDTQSGSILENEELEQTCERSRSSDDSENVQQTREFDGERRQHEAVSCEIGANDNNLTEQLNEGITVIDANLNCLTSADEKTSSNSDSSDTTGNHSDVIMPLNSDKKSENAEEELLNRDEVVNRKNRRIVRQNLVSDVLLISDNRPSEEVTKNEIPVYSISPTNQTLEKKVKKIERPKSKPAAPPQPITKINRDECDWESLFDDNGDCLEPSLIEELTAAVGEVTIEKPKNDYRPFTKVPIEVGNDEFAHVVEIYNFPSDFKTSDLAAVFSPFKNGGFELKWVDDTHCLGVFSSPLIAAEVLASDHSFVKTRPLSEATALSKTKARRSAEFLQPYRARPATCAALARRLVTGALGVKLATARQEREREKIVLREAKERRRLANKQREDAWDGIIAEK